MLAIVIVITTMPAAKKIYFYIHFFFFYIIVKLFVILFNNLERKITLISFFTFTLLFVVETFSGLELIGKGPVLTGLPNHAFLRPPPMHFCWSMGDSSPMSLIQVGHIKWMANSAKEDTSGQRIDDYSYET